MIELNSIIWPILLMAGGHTIRAIRFRILIGSTVTTSKTRVLWSLNLSYFINYFFPFRVGEIFRLLLTPNRISVKSLSIVGSFLLIERTYDLFLLILFSLSLFFLTSRYEFLDSSLFLLFPFSILLFFSAVTLFGKRIFKRTILSISSRFEPELQARLLEAILFSILAIRRNFFTLAGVKFQFATIVMWSFYIASIFLLSQTFDTKESNFPKTWSVFFGVTTNFWQINQELESAMTYAYQETILGSTALLVGILLTYSFFVKTSRKEVLASVKEFEPIMFANREEQLRFLRLYFSGTKSNFCRSYLNLNRGDVIMEDSSGASSATTALVNSNGKMIYRKYDGTNPDFLRAQARKMQNLRTIGYSDMLAVRDLDGLFAYEMPVVKDFVSLSEYRRFIPTAEFVEISKFIISEHFRISRLAVSVLNDLQIAKQQALSVDFLLSRMKSRTATLIELSDFFEIPSHSHLICNGRRVPGIDETLNYIDSITRNDLALSLHFQAYIHGDFSPENVIVNIESPQSYFLIDPDPSVEIGSILVDVAKYINYFLVGFGDLSSIKLMKESKNIYRVSMEGYDVYNALYPIRSILKDENIDIEEMEKVLSLYQLIHALRILPYQSKENQLKIYLRFFGQFPLRV